MKEFKHVIQDPMGLHARPAGMLVKAVAPYVLCHRLNLTSEARIAKENKNDIIKQLLQKTRIPL